MAVTSFRLPVDVLEKLDALAAKMPPKMRLKGRHASCRSAALLRIIELGMPQLAQEVNDGVLHNCIIVNHAEQIAMQALSEGFKQIRNAQPQASN
jgi:hypothetical protein